MLLSFLLVLGTAVDNPQVSANPESAKLEQLDWISGTWISGEPETSQTEIIWSKRRGNAFVGTWRMTKENGLVRYEILTMLDDGNKIQYRFDLFGRQSGFEKPQTNKFNLMSARKGYAKFRHTEQNAELTIALDDQGNMVGTWHDLDSRKSFEGYRVGKATAR